MVSSGKSRESAHGRKGDASHSLLPVDRSGSRLPFLYTSPTLSPTFFPPSHSSSTSSFLLLRQPSLSLFHPNPTTSLSLFRDSFSLSVALLPIHHRLQHLCSIRILWAFATPGILADHLINDYTTHHEGRNRLVRCLCSPRQCCCHSGAD